jgi:EmrB/QacA subfamily drug resistance transporter
MQPNAASTSSPTRSLGVVLAAVGIPAFMVALDNLVVGVALPRIRDDLHVTTAGLQWVVNAYTLPFAALLLTAAALGDRVGRRRIFIAGIVVFTLASAACALSTQDWQLNVARAVQGVGGAAVLPLSLTLLVHSVPDKVRTLAVGIWGGVYGLGVAIGPVVGGAIVEYLHWHFIFWLNVPIGVVAVVLATTVLSESHGPGHRLDPLGVVLSAGGLLLVVLGVVSGPQHGWGSTQVLVELIAGAVVLVAFVLWQARNKVPMMPLYLFQSRGFAIVNAVTFTFSAGAYGAIFLTSQFFQTAQGLSPLAAGARILPWTLMPTLVAPLAGHFGDRLGPHRLIAAGQILLAGALIWLGAGDAGVNTPYVDFVAPFILAGIGMAFTFAPISNQAISTAPVHGRGIASGVNNTVRQTAVAAGVAVAASIFSSFGSYASPQSFVDGLRPGVIVGSLIVAAGALFALFIPGMFPRRTTPAAPAAPTPSPVAR